ncbi:ABC transporter permease [Nocardia sp. NPDC057668]|uniref:ABC transporter permease n=1 Tax=Nocardia sp. NPDC057668 TaxID=3346202 RepID=UPI00366FFE55
MTSSRPTTTTARAPARTPGSGRPRAIWSTRAGAAGGTLAGLAIAATLWSLVVAADVFPRELFPSVAQVFRAGRTMWTEGLLGPDIAASLQRALIGFLIGALAGIAAAIVTASTWLGRRLLQPVLRLLAPVPTIGIVPLAILWFGIGEDSKALVIALGVFVPVWINSHAGFADTPADFLRAARCLGGGRVQTLTRVVLPEAAPDVVAGLRVGAAMAFVLIVVAEMTGTTEGIGYRIYQAQLFSQADRVIFCLIVLGIIGAACDLALATFTTPLTRWAREEH